MGKTPKIWDSRKTVTRKRGRVDVPRMVRLPHSQRKAGGRDQ
jgi:hypothetical protein